MYSTKFPGNGIRQAFWNIPELFQRTWSFPFIRCLQLPITISSLTIHIMIYSLTRGVSHLSKVTLLLVTDNQRQREDYCNKQLLKIASGYADRKWIIHHLHSSHVNRMGDDSRKGEGGEEDASEVEWDCQRSQATYNSFSVGDGALELSALLLLSEAK